MCLFANENEVENELFGSAFLGLAGFDSFSLSVHIYYIFSICRLGR